MLSINYNEKTKIELVDICKEKGIIGYGSKGFNTKDKIIQLIKGEIVYNDLRKKDNWSEKKKESFTNALNNRRKKNNLFDYLTKNNPSIINRFEGNIDDLKQISHSTMVHYKWKCINILECSNTFEARPRDVFRNDSKSSTKYCNLCKFKERGKIYQKNMLEKNGSIKTKIPNINNIWSDTNILKPEELTDNSHKKVKLKCPNKSTKHPEYDIFVYNIQESNTISCPKCSVKSSKAEMRIYSELKTNFKDVKWQQKIKGREADITIEDLKLVIEVDGYPWHKDKKNKDLEKNLIFEENGYTVLRIRDTKLEKINCNNIICDVSNFIITDFNNLIGWINNRFNIKILINSEFKNSNYYKEVQASLLSITFEESIENLFPESKELWDYKKNNPLLPAHFKRGSNMKVWIKCKEGHSYERPINRLFRIIKEKKHIMICPDCQTH